MTSETTILAGIEIPSVSPVFLAVVGIHVFLGIACVITGFTAILSKKRRGRHPEFGTILLLVFGGGICDRDLSVRDALGRRLPPVHSRSAFYRCRISWACGAPAGLHGCTLRAWASRTFCC
jgi:hypothetical protein